MYCTRLGLDYNKQEEVGSNSFCVEHRTLFCQIFPLSNNLEYPVFHGVMGDGIFNPLVRHVADADTRGCLLDKISLFGYSPTRT